MAHSLVKTTDAVIAALWEPVEENTSEFFRAALLGPLVVYTVFWAINAVLLVWHVWPKYSPVEHLKIHPGVYYSVPELIRLASNSFQNQIMMLGLSVAVHLAGLQKSRNSGVEGLPSVVDLAWQIPVCWVLADVFFYAAHGLLHLKWFYYKFHIVHHSVKYVVGVAAHYMHPVDMLLLGLAASLPSLIISRHILTQVVWGVIISAQTVLTHSGYYIPYFTGSPDHDFHHVEGYYANKRHRYTNLGSAVHIMDSLVGTYYSATPKVKGTRT